MMSPIARGFLFSAQLARLGFGAVLVAVTAVALHAQVLLIVDVTNPSQVRLIATGAPASVEGVESVTDTGVTLRNFFTGSGADSLDGQDKLPGYDLLPSDASASVPYEKFWVNAGVDLNLYESSTGATQTETFHDHIAAFTGEMRGDFTSWTALLPSSGASGDIYESGTDTVIGTWQAQSAIPEPATYAAWTGLLALGVVAFKRRRRTALTPAADSRPRA